MAPGETGPRATRVPATVGRDVKVPHADLAMTGRGRTALRSIGAHPVRAAHRTGSGRPAHVPIVAAPVDRVDLAARGMPGGRPALARIAEVRGPGRATDSDRVRGRDHGRIAVPTNRTRARATNRGSPTTGPPARDASTAVARSSGRAPPGQAVDHSGGRPVAASGIDRTKPGRVATGDTNGPRGTLGAAARPAGSRCRRPRPSAPKRSSSPAAGPSRRRSSPGDPRSGSLSSPSAEPPSRSSCSMRRTCVSRSSKSKAAR